MSIENDFESLKAVHDVTNQSVKRLEKEISRLEEKRLRVAEAFKDTSLSTERIAELSVNGLKDLQGRSHILKELSEIIEDYSQYPDP